MARLESVSTDALEEALDAVDGKKETIRLVAALIYKRGPSVPMIAEWLNVREATIYRWFDRMESEPLREAVQDRPRPGRPPKLSESARETFEEVVREPPTASGFDRDHWTTSLAARYLAEEFGVDYTERHVQRLLREVGLAPERAGSAEADNRERIWLPAN